MVRPIVLCYTKIEDGEIKFGVLCVDDNEKDADRRLEAFNDGKGENDFKAFKLYPSMW